MEPTAFKEIGGALLRGVVAGLATRGALSLIPDSVTPNKDGDITRFISPELEAAGADVRGRMLKLGIKPEDAITPR